MKHIWNNHNLQIVFQVCPSEISKYISVILHWFSIFFNYRSDAQRAAKQKEAKERELEHAAFSADRIEEGGFPPVSMVSNLCSLMPRWEMESKGDTLQKIQSLCLMKCSSRVFIQEKKLRNVCNEKWFNICTMLVFCIFWSISLELFINHKPPISEECFCNAHSGRPGRRPSSPKRKDPQEALVRSLRWWFRFPLG